MSTLVQPVNRALEEAFLSCHAEGHQWHHERGTIGTDDPDPGPGLRAPFDQPARGKRSTCSSCTSERIRWYVRSGDVVNRYRYADGYLHKRDTPDDNAPTRQEWRRRLVVTLFDDVTPKRGRRKSA